MNVRKTWTMRTPSSFRLQPLFGPLVENVRTTAPDVHARRAEICSGGTRMELNIWSILARICSDSWRSDPFALHQELKSVLYKPY